MGKQISNKSGNGYKNIYLHVLGHFWTPEIFFFFCPPHKVRIVREAKKIPQGSFFYGLIKTVVGYLSSKVPEHLVRVHGLMKLKLACLCQETGTRSSLDLLSGQWLKQWLCKSGEILWREMVSQMPCSVFSNLIKCSRSIVCNVSAKRGFTKY